MIRLALALILVFGVAEARPRDPGAVTIKNDYPARAQAIVHRLKDELDAILKGLTG
jgi:hypothetical protein